MGQVFAGGGFILDKPDEIAFFNLARLKGALKLELLGMKMSRGPTAYSQLKKMGFKGTREAVLEAVEAKVKHAIAVKQAGG